MAEFLETTYDKFVFKVKNGFFYSSSRFLGRPSGPKGSHRRDRFLAEGQR